MFLLLAVEILAAVIVLAVSAFFAYWAYLKRTHYWYGKNIPSEPPFPLLGNMAAMMLGKGYHNIDSKLYKKHGRLFGNYNGYTPTLYVAEPELLKLIFVKDFNVFSSRRFFSTGNPLMDHMIAALPGDEKWRNIRNTITPAFSSGKLKNMIPIISESAQISVRHLEKYADNQENIDCRTFFAGFSLDVIANVAFGTRLDSHNDPNSVFVQNAKKVSLREVPLKTLLAFTFPAIGRLFKIEFFPSESINFLGDLTYSIMKRRQETKEVRHDFLQIMMEGLKADSSDNTSSNADTEDGDKTTTGVKSVDSIKRKPLTKNEALAQCIAFLMAGFESPATTLTMTAYNLATHPEIQKKVIAEVDKIWENRETLDSEALFEAKYLEAVIDETLRISPPGIRLERTAGKDYDLGDTGIHIPKGMIIQIPVYAMHHDPKYFPEPEKFKPERFYPKEKEEVKPYTYLPFGQGPRHCVAMRLALQQIKILMLNALRTVEFVTCQDTKIPVEYVKQAVNLQPKNVILRVRRRRS